MVKLEKNKHRLCVLIDENSYTELHRVCNTNVKTHIITYRYKCLNTNNGFPSLTYTHHFPPTIFYIVKRTNLLLYSFLQLVQLHIKIN